MHYENQPPRAFWKLCREAELFNLSELYQPKVVLKPGQQIATAGSCFAQNIGRYIRRSELTLVDAEPAPKIMPDEVAKSFGYRLYSARYGNIYTAQQLHQLLSDAMTGQIHEGAIAVQEGRYHDLLRPSCEPEGFASKEELVAHRLDHLQRVKRVFELADAFVFTLGLTEAWMDAQTGLVFPTAPGVVAGTFDPKRHVFENFGFVETHKALSAAIALIRQLAPDLPVLLTVSPVPLVATATPRHVLSATTYSKSVLRAVAEECALNDPLVDYVPSYEVITGTPFAAQFYDKNLRTVTSDGVQAVMDMFFRAQGLKVPKLSDMPSALPVGDQAFSDADDLEELFCEEALLEGFAQS